MSALVSSRDSIQQPLISPSFQVDTRYNPNTARTQRETSNNIMANAAMSRMTSASKSVSKRLVLSYVLDWIIIFILVIAGGGLQLARPYHRAFTILSLDNSFPLLDETVPIWLAAVLAIAMPIAVVAVVALAFVPGFAASRTMSRKKMWKVKLWELERGLAGLCLSLAGAFFITQCLKNLFGKPRPNMLARCQPDVANFANYIVGVSGYGSDISSHWALVSHEICKNPDRSVLDDGFRSFPSGHSSISWAGLLYLTLFLCSKFNVTIPSLPSVLAQQRDSRQSLPTEQEMTPLQRNGQPVDPRKDSTSYDRTTSFPESDPVQSNTTSSTHPFQIRHMAASPPNHLLIPAFTPIGIALWICATRYSDFYHFGFDIISGSIIGILTAWFSFRWYHLPLSRGHGWAWGARSVDRAFGIGVGTDGYVRDHGARKRDEDRRHDIV